MEDILTLTGRADAGWAEKMGPLLHGLAPPRRSLDFTGNQYQSSKRHANVLTIFFFIQTLVSNSQLPIYSNAGEPIQVVETHTVLEEHVGDARRAIVGATEDLRQSVHRTVSRWIGVERRVEKRVLDILPADEPLNPGVLYVGIATLAGSVFGRYSEFRERGRMLTIITKWKN